MRHPVSLTAAVGTVRQSLSVTLLDRYVGFAAFMAVLQVAAALTALFSLLEFVEQLSSVGQGHYRLIDALVYVLLTVPSRVLQVTPVSMLLGCLLALGALARGSELTALRSLGFSEKRIIGSVLKLVPPIIVALFLMEQFVIPPAQQLALEQRTSALSPSGSLHNDDGFWAQGDRQYLNVQQFEYGKIPKDIDIYAFNAEGRLDSFVHADRADVLPDGTWRLVGVQKNTIRGEQFQTEQLESLLWHSFLPPNETQLMTLAPENMPPIALYGYVRDLEKRHQQALRYEQELWAKAGMPLSLVAMIMIAMPFVFGSPRAQNAGLQITIGAVFGIVFSLSEQISSRLDLLLDLNPAVTALAPSLLLMALAVYLFRHAHRRRAAPLISHFPDPGSTPDP